MADPTVEFMNSMKNLLLNWKEAVEAAYIAQVSNPGIQRLNCPAIPCRATEWKKVEVAAMTDISVLAIQFQNQITQRDTESRDDGDREEYDSGYDDGRDTMYEELQPDVDRLEGQLEDMTSERNRLQIDLDNVNGEMASKIREVEELETMVGNLGGELSECQEKV